MIYSALSAFVAEQRANICHDDEAEELTGALLGQQ